MKIRFGYVSHAISLWEASPAKTMTFTRYKTLENSVRTEKLLELTRINIENTKRMLYYNAAHGIEVYRMSSSIVPLATHPEVMWDFVTPFHEEWLDLGQFVKEKGFRVSFHPNQFTLFTSPRPEVTDNAVIDMEYHFKMLDAMGLAEQGNINIHIGGAYGDKDAALERFHPNLTKLPSSVKARMTLENDDKTYNAEETLAVCEREKIPFVFDYHHHMANLSEKSLEEMLPAIFDTWEHTGMVPKIHISSPKTESAFRSHADFVDPAFIRPFLDLLRGVNKDVDFMIEAKAKDQACLRLVEDISKIRGVKRTGGAQIQW